MSQGERKEMKYTLAFHAEGKNPLWPELQTLQTKQNAFKPSTSILQFLLHLPPILRGPHAKELLDAGN